MSLENKDIPQLNENEQQKLSPELEVESTVPLADIEEVAWRIGNHAPEIEHPDRTSSAAADQGHFHNADVGDLYSYRAARDKRIAQEIADSQTRHPSQFGGQFRTPDTQRPLGRLRLRGESENESSPSGHESYKPLSPEASVIGLEYINKIREQRAKQQKEGKLS